MDLSHALIGPTTTGLVQGAVNALLAGFTVRETGAAATVTFVVRIASGTGPLLGGGVIAISGDRSVLFDPPVDCEGGIHVTVAGTGVPESAFYLV